MRGTLTIRDPILCYAYKCDGCEELHEDRDAAEKCCPTCNCPHCDRCQNRTGFLPRTVFRCPDCNSLDDHRPHIEDRKCCSALPVEAQERVAL